MKSFPIIATLAIAAAAGPAAAQLTNTKAPVDVTADQLDTSNTDCVSTWRGNVEALQDNARLRTDTLKMYMQPKGSRSASTGAGGSCGDLVKMEALGSVFYVTPQQRVHGDNAVYEADSDTITLTGDVVAAQGQNVLRGERMVINVKTGQGQMQTSVKGRNKPGRVRGVFYPNQSNNPQSGKSTAPTGQRR